MVGVAVAVALGPAVVVDEADFGNAYAAVVEDVLAAITFIVEVTVQITDPQVPVVTVLLLADEAAEPMATGPPCGVVLAVELEGVVDVVERTLACTYCVEWLVTVFVLVTLVVAVLVLVLDGTAGSGEVEDEAVDAEPELGGKLARM